MAIGDWDDNRSVANYQQVIEHEEFAELAADQNRMLLGYDRMTAAIAGDGSDTISFNLAAWTEASWYTGLYIRSGQAWDGLGAWIYISANSGTNYIRLEVRDENDNTIATIPNATGATVSGIGWVQIDKHHSTGLAESDGILYSVAVLGRCPSGSFSAKYLQVYLTSSLEP